MADVRPGAIFEGYEFIGPMEVDGPGNVFLVKSRQFKCFGVCRFWTLDGDADSLWESFSADVKEIMRLNHPNSVRVFAHFRVVNTFFLITERCVKGSLREYMRKSGPVKSSMLAKIARDLCSVMRAAWARGIRHPGVSPDSILFSDTGVIRVMGWTVPTVEAAEQRCKKSACSTWCLAPEVLSGAYRAGEKCGMWSLGVTLLWLATGAPPWDMKDEKVREQIERGEYTVPENMRPGLVRVVKGLIVVDPDRRMMPEEEEMERIAGAQGQRQGQRRRAVADTPDGRSVNEDVGQMMTVQGLLGQPESVRRDEADCAKVPKSAAHSQPPGQQGSRPRMRCDWNGATGRGMLAASGTVGPSALKSLIRGETDQMKAPGSPVYNETQQGIRPQMRRESNVMTGRGMLAASGAMGPDALKLLTQGEGDQVKSTGSPACSETQQGIRPQMRRDSNGMIGRGMLAASGTMGPGSLKSLIRGETDQMKAPGSPVYNETQGFRPWMRRESNGMAGRGLAIPSGAMGPDALELLMKGEADQSKGRKAPAHSEPPTPQGFRQQVRGDSNGMMSGHGMLATSTSLRPGSLKALIRGEVDQGKEAWPAAQAETAAPQGQRPVPVGSSGPREKVAGQRTLARLPGRKPPISRGEPRKAG